MIISRIFLDGVCLVRISGLVDRHGSGRLFDALAECLAERRDLIIDLSEVELLTRAGMRGLIVAAKLAQLSRGQLRICGAKSEMVDYLGTMGLDHLIKFDPGVTAALFQLNAWQSATNLRAEPVAPEPANAQAMQQPARLSA